MEIGTSCGEGSEFKRFSKLVYKKAKKGRLSKRMGPCEGAAQEKERNRLTVRKMDSWVYCEQKSGMDQFAKKKKKKKVKTNKVAIKGGADRWGYLLEKGTKLSGNLFRKQKGAEGLWQSKTHQASEFQ